MACRCSWEMRRLSRLRNKLGLAFRSTNTLVTESTFMTAANAAHEKRVSFMEETGDAAEMCFICAHPYSRY
jgi:hypothetical protein